MSKDINRQKSKVALFSGHGNLPSTIIRELVSQKIDFFVVVFDLSLKQKFNKYTVIEAKIETISFLFKFLKRENVSRVVFAGAMRRPIIKMADFERDSLDLLTPALVNLNKGDDELFRSIKQVFMSNGFHIESPQSICTDLVNSEGVLGKIKPSKYDIKDAKIALQVFKKLYKTDIGQGLVVSQGLCIGVETLPGTDAMLKFVGENLEGLRYRQDGSKGLLLKGLKAGQEESIDLPTIGPNTIKAVAQAGLSGIVLQENSVIVLDKRLSISLADKSNIFIWSVNWKTLDKDA